MTRPSLGNHYVHLLDSVVILITVWQLHVFLSLKNSIYYRADELAFLKRLSHCFGVLGSAHTWFSSYSSGRPDSALIGSSSSPVTSYICGVPLRLCSGTCTLSNLHFSYTSQFNVRQQQYADDTQIMLIFSPSSLESSLDHLQQCLSPLTSRFFHSGFANNSN